MLTATCRVPRYPRPSSGWMICLSLAVSLTNTRAGAPTNALSGSTSTTLAQGLLFGSQENFQQSRAPATVSRRPPRPRLTWGCIPGPNTPHVLCKHLRETVSRAPAPGSFPKAFGQPGAMGERPEGQPRLSSSPVGGPAPRLGWVVADSPPSILAWPSLASPGRPPSGRVHTAELGQLGG